MGRSNDGNSRHASKKTQCVIGETRHREADFNLDGTGWSAVKVRDSRTLEGFTCMSPTIRRRLRRSP